MAEKLVSCTITELFVLYADRVVIEVSRVSTKDRAVFLQQSHLNVVKCLGL
jgi:hypothetical protein